MPALGGLVASPTIDLGTQGKPGNTSSRQPSGSATDLFSVPDALLNPVTRAAISMEYSSLRFHKHCPTGMYIIPSAESILVWDAVLFVHKGYHAGSVLKFTMAFPRDYPDKPPAVRFLTDVFHPLVATQTGLLNLMARFRPWRPKEHRIHDVLHFIKAMFKEPALDRINELDAVNPGAFKYRDNRASFAGLAQQSSRFSQSPSALYDTPNSKKSYSFSFTQVPQENVDRVLTILGISEHRVETGLE